MDDLLDGPDNYEGFDGLAEWEMRNKLNCLEDFFEGVIAQLYKKEALDIEKLEWYLEEMGHQLGVKVPDSDIMIKRKN